jgi:hypothetical protein
MGHFGVYSLLRYNKENKVIPFFALRDCNRVLITLKNLILFQMWLEQMKLYDYKDKYKN